MSRVLDSGAYARGVGADPAHAAAVPARTPFAPGAPMRPEPTLSCVLPCYNEAQNLSQLLPLLCTLLPRCSRAWEVVLVDDGSSDATVPLLAAWARKPGFKVLTLSRNFGKEAALSAGFEIAAGEVVVSMDADGQHPPSLIADFVAQWRRGADVVYAMRRSRADEGRVKRLGARWFYKLMNSDQAFQMPDGAGDFRLMDRRVVDTLNTLPERNRFMKGLYAWVGYDAVALPYEPEPRAHGSSHFSLLRLLRLSLDGLTAFTTWPLRAVSAVGFAMALLAFGYGGTLTAEYLLYGHVVSGWTTIVVSLMLLSGIQLVSLGVVGEYVGRIFREVKARPLYVVKRQAGQGLGVPPGTAARRAAPPATMKASALAPLT